MSDVLTQARDHLFASCEAAVSFVLRRGRKRLPGKDDTERGATAVPVTLVTGASGAIGAALAEQFASDSKRLVLTGQDETALQALARRLGAARLALDARVVVADLTDPAERQRLLDRACADDGYIDRLVNAAGLGSAGPFDSTDAARLDDLVAVNVAALTALTHAVLPGMIARRRGGVLNIASLGGFVPGAGQAAYYASKAYVISLSEALAEETAGSGVRIVCVAPGAVTSSFHARMGVGSAWYRQIPGELTPERVAAAARVAYAAAIPLTVPGVVPRLYAVALRFLPHTISVPLMARLLQERGACEDADREVDPAPTENGASATATDFVEVETIGTGPATACPPRPAGVESGKAGYTPTKDEEVRQRDG